MKIPVLIVLIFSVVQGEAYNKYCYVVFQKAISALEKWKMEPIREN